MECVRSFFLSRLVCKFFIFFLLVRKKRNNYEVNFNEFFNSNDNLFTDSVITENKKKFSELINAGCSSSLFVVLISYEYRYKIFVKKNLYKYFLKKFENKKMVLLPRVYDNPRVVS
ncbi:hypothetical protein PUN28_012957 [Cardiocondyla obscurior]|uniref:Uncharacterized protein n=1 Tax=Cardiocondyla obscurior TaxID=286306 RepID=A0AAW2F681_9HYME